MNYAHHIFKTLITPEFIFTIQALLSIIAFLTSSNFQTIFDAAAVI